MRHAKAILRQAAYLGQRTGDRVWKRHDVIWVNGVKYTVDTVDDIPNELRLKKKKKKAKKDMPSAKENESSEVRKDGMEQNQ